MTSIKCPKCGDMLSSDADVRGCDVQCPACSHTFKVSNVVVMNRVERHGFGYKFGYGLLGFALNIPGVFIAHGIGGRDAAMCSLVGFVSIVAIIAVAALLDAVSGMLSAF